MFVYRFEFWTNVCGFDFSPAIQHAHRQLLQQPLTTDLDLYQVKADPKVMRQFDLRTVTLLDVQTLSEKMSFQTEHACTVHGFAIWFDVDFRQGEQLRQALELNENSENNLDENPSLNDCVSQSGDNNQREATVSKIDEKSSSEITISDSGDCVMKNSNINNGINNNKEEDSSKVTSSNTKSSNFLPKSNAAKPKSNLLSDWKNVSKDVLSTSPASPETHWKQTVLFLPRPLAVDPSDLVTCRVTLTQGEVNKRHYNIELEMVGSDEEEEESCDEDEGR